jgi:hypothetical protein
LLIEGLFEHRHALPAPELGPHDPDEFAASLRDRGFLITKREQPRDDSLGAAESALSHARGDNIVQDLQHLEERLLVIVQREDRRQNVDQLLHVILRRVIGHLLPQRGDLLIREREYRAPGLNRHLGDQLQFRIRRGGFRACGGLVRAGRSSG